MNWFQAALVQAESYFSNEQDSIETAQARGLAAIDGFHHLFHELVKELRIRDTWKEQLCEISPFAIGTVERSEKTGQQFVFTITPEGWKIESGLSNTEHIRHMTDQFWAHILKLTKIGAASLRESGVRDSSPSVKRLTQHHGSLIFSLARDYVLLMQAPGEGLYSPCDSLGGIEVLLPLKSDEATVRNFYLDGLEAFYRANYLLHRSAYLDMKRVLKRYNGSNPNPQAAAH